MRLIDADALESKVLKWMPPDPCGIEEKEYPFETDIVVSLMMEIQEAPTIEPKQGEWVPCSERLPEKGHYYLWCSDRGSVQSDYYWDGFDKEHKYGYNIVAWMPLPEPWEGADMIRSEQLLKESREQDHTCEFCYYELFDDKAYPCSRCVCNQPTENLWRPKVNDEPQTDCQWK